MNFNENHHEYLFARFSRLFGKFMVIFIDGPPESQYSKLEFFDMLYAKLDFTFIGGDGNLFKTNFQNSDDADLYLLNLEDFYFKIELLELPLHINDTYPINILTNLILSDSEFEERRSRLHRKNTCYEFI
jgi:hypothetical protein